MAKFPIPAALLAALLSVPVHAQDRLPDVRVSYADLDLSTPAGMKALDHRLRDAAEAACSSDHGINDLSRLGTIRQCRASKLREVDGVRRAALAKASGTAMAVAAK